jgi:general secretion pathway protein C
MNKRLPLLLSLLGMILLAASLAYWILQLYQPPQRPLAAVPHASLPDPPAEAAATLFGGQPAAASTTNYQLTGVVAAGPDSVAIIVADNAPPKALKVGRELAPGVKLAEVYPRYVMLLDGGVMKRVDLAQDAKAAAPMGAPAGALPPGAPPPPAMNMQPGTQLPAPAQPLPTSQAAPPQAAPTPAPEPPPETTPLAPGAVMQQQSEPPPANPNSTPPQAPVRTTGVPTTQNPAAQ